ncbi:MAG: hypothetical protein MUF87_19835 [Anaerolineae bacterium]|nr:hypothetical protein [Anaerolineae bacterium]
MDAECDGGGNRSQTKIDLTLAAHRDLKTIYPERDALVPGVCSLKMNNDHQPWIVCPRRLLVLGRQQEGVRTYQRDLETKLLQVLAYPIGTKLGVWKEVQINYVGRNENLIKKFEYTFDYVLLPTLDLPIAEIELKNIKPDSAKNLQSLKRKLEGNGFSVSEDHQVKGGYIVHDFPHGKPSIIEIMTSSTSGGNKKKGTQIAQAFEKAILGQPHEAPSINYRQIWARMVSQLLVKSEVALGWGGQTVWILQDTLVDYISRTTGLNIYNFQNEILDEVNIMSISYGDFKQFNPHETLDLPQKTLFSGPITPANEQNSAPQPSFIDIIRQPIQPPKSKLMDVIIAAGPAKNYLT